MSKICKIITEYDTRTTELIESYKCALHGDESEVLRETTYFAVSPVLFMYTKWVLLQARDMKIRRLYFLARDAEILYKIAQMITQKNKLDIECRYLYSSRQSWRLPTLHLMEDPFEYIFLKSYNFSLNKILNRINLDDAERENIVRQIDFKKSLDSVLTDSELASLKSQLENCSFFTELTFKKSKDAYANTIGYLAQEGIFDGATCALVDTGWTGSLQYCLNILMKSHGNQQYIRGFYFGLFDLPSSEKDENYSAFYFDRSRNDDNVKRKLYFNNNLFECFCANSDGMTIGFEKKGEVFLPIFQQQCNQQDLDFKKLQRKLILDACAAMLKNDVLNLDYQPALAATTKICKRLMCRPTFDEAETYGKILFSDDVFINQQNELAPKLTKNELRYFNIIRRLYYRLLKKDTTQIPVSLWLEGSVMRSDVNNTQWYLLSARMYNYLKLIKKTISQRRRQAKIRKNGGTN